MRAAIAAFHAAFANASEAESSMRETAALVSAEAEQAERERWEQAQRIALEHPGVSVANVRNGLEYLRSQAQWDRVELSEEQVEAMARAAITAAASIGEPHPVYGLVYDLCFPPESRKPSIPDALAKHLPETYREYQPRSPLPKYRPEPPHLRRKRWT